MTEFTCNVCGAACRRSPELGRELANCAECGSTVRLRALLALLSQELFGALLTLPEFPVLKGIRGIGMSDPPDLAGRLAEKFDYTNTFYHQAPLFDVTNPAPGDSERYDFILSSEVMEHVPPPVERSFAALHRMLKRDAVLLLTTPYTIDGRTAEHFPELHQYALAAPGGRTVLVNRRRDGSLEVFENLVFHGGHGSTLEMRLFTEPCLRAILIGAGFDGVHFAAENFPECGVEHSESWSLPIAARKGKLRPPSAELALQYRDACRLAARKIRDLEAITAEYRRNTAHHERAQAEWMRDSERRIAWTKKVEEDWEERTRWALQLESDRTEALAEFQRAKAAEEEAWKQLKDAQAEIVRVQSKLWTRIGRTLGAMD